MSIHFEIDLETDSQWGNQSIPVPALKPQTYLAQLRLDPSFNKTHNGRSLEKKKYSYILKIENGHAAIVDSLDRVIEFNSSK